MAIKTKANKADVQLFIDSIENEARRNDARTLVELYERITGEPAVMWGESIIGFGSYHYKSKRSSQEGDWMLAGFSPRKQNLSLYLTVGFDSLTNLLTELGPHKTSVACLYIKTLDQIDINVLEKIIDKSFKTAQAKFLS